VGVLSVSATKFFWYANPIYPLIALGASYPLTLFAEKLIESNVSSFVAFAALAALFIQPVVANLDYTYNPKGKEDWDPIQGRFYQATARSVSKLIKKGELPVLTNIVTYGPTTHLLWYKHLAAHQGKQVEVHTNYSTITGGQLLITVDTSFIPLLRSKYDLSLRELEMGSAVFDMKAKN
jgi:hypothetical protein